MAATFMGWANTLDSRWVWAWPKPCVNVCWH